MVVGKKNRFYGQLKPFAGFSSQGNKFQYISQTVSHGDIEEIQSIDTFGRDIIQRDVLPEGQGSQKGKFMGGIHAVHIQGGVGLRQTLGLGHFKSLDIGFTLFNHLSKDEVGCSVDDTVDGFDVVCQQPVHQSSDDGNTPGATGFKTDAHIVFPGQSEKFCSVVG